MNDSLNKLAFIGEIIPDELTNYYKSLGKTNFSGSIFNACLLKGLKKHYEDVTVFSCPGVGHYPIFSKCKRTKTFIMENDILCLGYNNFIGINNYSKKRRILSEFSKRYSPNDVIDVVVSESSYFSLMVFESIKKRYKNVKGILLVFDLPENIVGNRKSIIYKALKNLSYKKIKTLYKLFDGFVFLAESMNQKVNLLGKPYRVFPCVADLDVYSGIERKTNNDKYVITYSGTVSKQFNIDLLLEAFSLIKEPSCVLQIIGGGDGVKLVKDAMTIDQRIKYVGVVEPKEALKFQLNSNCLVNPRLPNSAYSSESFPSKTINYILTENPVVSYAFSSFPNEILQLVNIPKDFSSYELAKTIMKCREKKYTKNIREVLNKYSYYSCASVFKEMFSYVRLN